jgi:hypothetical protein
LVNPDSKIRLVVQCLGMWTGWLIMLLIGMYGEVHH